MNVSPDFSLPLRLIAPYFVLAVLFYIVSMGLLFTLTPGMNSHDLRVIGWVHTYMIGFVMMVIIGAMGQLSVVVGEIHHRYPKLFGWIGVLLGAGTVILVSGFYYDLFLLPYGGGVIGIALSLFAFNLFVTLTHSRRRTSVTRSMQWSTFFLGIGLGLGILMALGYAGSVDTDPSYWRMGHMFALFGGYIMINIMGVSTVLLPMFGACNRPADSDYTISFYMMAASVVTMILAAFFHSQWLETVALLLGVGSITYYMFQVYLIFTSKKRHYSDIWERSVTVAFIALVLAMGIGMYGVLRGDEKGVILAFWFLTVGFLGFLITAHLYKIVPFLIWFERYAPFIDERDVPMLHQLLPARWANLQWGLALSGLVISAFAIVFSHPLLWQMGVLLLAGSGLVLLGILTKLLRDKL